VGVRLAQAANAHVWRWRWRRLKMARPTGVERADAINIRIPIEGAAMASEGIA
jgi:hypothetical protein